MPNTKLLIFGHPKAEPQSFSQRPALASEDSAGDVWPCYNSPGYIQSRHGFPQELAQSIAGIADLAKIASE